MDIKERNRIARRGKIVYFKYFNSTIVSDYILSKTIGIKSKKTFIWDKE